MRLYVEELKGTPLVQEFTRTETCLLDRVRLHLCKYQYPSGTFSLSVLDEDDNVLITCSQSLADMEEGGLSTEPYYHGFVTFQLWHALTLRKGQTYKLSLSATGYTYADGVFLGWVKDTQGDPIAGTHDAAAYSAESSYDYELYKLEKVR